MGCGVGVVVGGVGVLPKVSARGWGDTMWA
jgi:hypothetical protein